MATKTALVSSPAGVRTGSASMLPWLGWSLLVLLADQLTKLLILGAYRLGVQFPCVIRGEGVGRAPDGRRVYFGERSVAPFGAWAEQTLVPTEEVWDVPDDVDDVLAITMGIAGTGALLPLDRGAAGTIILAFEDGMTGEKYDRARAAFSAVSYGERDPDCAGIASPVFGADRKLAGALSVSGPRSRFTDDNVKVMVAAVADAAQRITRSLGGGQMQNGLLPNSAQIRG